MLTYWLLIKDREMFVHNPFYEYRHACGLENIQDILQLGDILWSNAKTSFTGLE